MRRRLFVPLMTILILSFIGYTPETKALLVVEECFNGPPPAGFTGPPITGICSFSWEVGGSAIKGRHDARTTILPHIDPSTGLIHVVNKRTSDVRVDVAASLNAPPHLWVVQTVCSSHGSLPGWLSGIGIGFRYEQGSSRSGGFVVDNSDSDTTQGEYQNTCVGSPPAGTDMKAIEIF